MSYSHDELVLTDDDRDFIDEVAGYIIKHGYVPEFMHRGVEDAGLGDQVIEAVEESGSPTDLTTATRLFG